MSEVEPAEYSLLVKDCQWQCHPGKSNYDSLATVLGKGAMASFGPMCSQDIRPAANLTTPATIPVTNRKLLRVLVSQMPFHIVFIFEGLGAFGT